MIFPSKILSKQLVGINLYSNYNEVGFDRIIYKIWDSLRSGFTLPFDYLQLLHSKNTNTILVVSIIIYTALLLFYVNNKKIKYYSKNFYFQIFIGPTLVIFAVFPYYLVNKPPLAIDFYESRHLLLAIPGIVLSILAISNVIFYFVKNINSNFGLRVKILFLAIVLSISTTNAISFGMNLARDWLKQVDIINYIKSYEDQVKNYGVIIIDDLTQGLSVRDRYIYHYEYSGIINKTTNSRDYMGISLSEYRDSSVKSPIFSNKDYHEFYNINNLDISKPFLALQLTNVEPREKSVDILKSLLGYWFSGANYVSRPAIVVKITAATEFHEAEIMVERIESIKSALEKFKLSNRKYPISISSGYSESPSLRNIVSFGANLYKSDILERDLVPKYINEGFFDQRCNEFRIKCDYIYLSNGVDYKLVYLNPSDLFYGRQAFPSYVDLYGRYGVWTPGAIRW